ncbi:ribonuclease H-like domain-containing protein [Tanacetum coccineum]
MYKARLVANGRSQRYGVDCDITFSLVVKPATIRTVLSLALSQNWLIHQFLTGIFLRLFICTSCLVSTVCGTLDFGLQLYASSTRSFVAYSDADWVDCPTNRHSTLGYCVFLGNNLLSWSAKRQHSLSRVSAKVEYRGVANVVAETTWLHNLLRELHMPLSSATLVYCDNVNAIYLTANPVQH